MRDLLALVEQERIEELAQLVTVDEIAIAWCRYSASQRDSSPAVMDDDDDSDPDWWSVQLWMTPGWWGRRDLVREGLLALVRHAADDDVLAHVSAGPLETFVGSGESELDWLEMQARQSAKFRRALARVWIWDQPAEVFQRIEKAAQTPLPRSGDHA